MSTFLMIENPGIAPVEAITLLGVSTTRHANTSGTIGTFGTGFKHAIALLLREHLPPTIFLGKQRLDFESREKTVDDGITSHEYGQIFCKMSGVGRAKELSLGFVTEMGVHDWNDTSMACREIVANALDRALREEGNHYSTTVRIVGEEAVAPKAGYTRVFIPMSYAIQEFHQHLGSRFLHFSEPESVSSWLLSKRPSRAIGSERKATALIYKQGVFVRQIRSTNEESLYDYNCGDELQLDECRNVSDGDVTYKVASRWGHASTRELVPLLRSLVAINSGGKTYWEHTIDASCLKLYGSPERAENVERAQRWQRAWALATRSEGTVACSCLTLAEHTEAKGYGVVIIPSQWITVLKSYGIATEIDILSADEQQGRQLTEPTADVLAALDDVWSAIVECGMHGTREAPEVDCFTATMSGGKEVLGYWNPQSDRIAVNTIIADGKSQMLYAVLVEECVHYLTKATDGSRDLQNFAFQLTAAMLAKRIS